MASFSLQVVDLSNLIVNHVLNNVNKLMRDLIRNLMYHQINVLYDKGDIHNQWLFKLYKQNISTTIERNHKCYHLIRPQVHGNIIII